ncbi:hypothetical protein G8C93_00835 [Cellulosimicrobium cellulans]|uniref:hypothetical protein n=1 Tax=Cellulosimicrobium cellulans TaxID=1710 RepID=UPI0018839608|nr:hypothetical protein [Cellulosimicrobium cellulans]MBE9924437.1 hypothetical protein [Cellulosimicrobium cellulans]
MTTEYFAVHADGQHLVSPDGHIAEEGETVIRVVLPNGDVHVIQKPEGVNYVLHPGWGLLTIQRTTGARGQAKALRQYGAWTYVEEIPFEQSGPSIW